MKKWLSVSDYACLRESVCVRVRVRERKSNEVGENVNGQNEWQKEIGIIPKYCLPVRACVVMKESMKVHVVGVFACRVERNFNNYSVLLHIHFFIIIRLRINQIGEVDIISKHCKN